MLAGKSLASIASKGMVLPTSARAAAPAHLEILRKRFDQVSIAVVGSSGTLLYGEESVGVEIDAHDVIVRVNQAPAQHWEAEVGSRTDVRVTYSAGLENIQRQERSGWPHIVTPGELLVFSWLAMPPQCDVADADGEACMHDMSEMAFSEALISNEQTADLGPNASVWHLHTEIPGPEVITGLLRDVWKLGGVERLAPFHRNTGRIKLWNHFRANPTVVLSHRWILDMHRTVLGGAAVWPSTGFTALALVLAFRSSSRRVSVYGFGACGDCPKYYSCDGAYGDGNGYHSFETEALLRRRWADEGTIHLHEPACEGRRHEALARPMPAPSPALPLGAMEPCERLVSWWHDPRRTRVNSPAAEAMTFCTGWGNGWGEEECELGYWWTRPGGAGHPAYYGGCEWNAAKSKCNVSLERSWVCNGLPPPSPPSLPSPSLLPSPNPSSPPSSPPRPAMPPPSHPPFAPPATPATPVLLVALPLALLGIFLTWRLHRRRRRAVGSLHRSGYLRASVVENLAEEEQAAEAVAEEAAEAILLGIEHFGDSAGATSTAPAVELLPMVESAAQPDAAVVAPAAEPREADGIHAAPSPPEVVEEEEEEVYSL